MIRLDPIQEETLAKRAHRQNKSFSQEMRLALQLYLDSSLSHLDELPELARTANRSVDRSLKSLDSAIKAVRRALKRAGKNLRLPEY